MSERYINNGNHNTEKKLFEVRTNEIIFNAFFMLRFIVLQVTYRMQCRSTYLPRLMDIRFRHYLLLLLPFGCNIRVEKLVDLFLYLTDY